MRPPYALLALQISPTPSLTTLNAAPSVLLATKYRFQTTVPRARQAHFRIPMTYHVTHAPLGSTLQWPTALPPAAHADLARISLKWLSALLWISVEVSVPTALLGPTLFMGGCLAPSALLEKIQLMGPAHAVLAHLPAWVPAHTVTQASSRNLLGL